MSGKVTDLERFSFEEIWRPYWTWYDRPDRPLTERDAFGQEARLLERPFKDLTGTVEALTVDDRWSRAVLERIADIGFFFPDYVRHPLVDLIRSKAKRDDPSSACPRLVPVEDEPGEPGESCVVGWWSKRLGAVATATRVAGPVYAWWDGELHLPWDRIREDSDGLVYMVTLPDGGAS